MQFIAMPALRMRPYRKAVLKSATPVKYLKRPAIKMG
jgi:hypothetical protein